MEISRQLGSVINNFKTYTSKERPKKRKREDPTDTLAGLGVYLLENPKLYEQPPSIEEDKEIMIDEDIRHWLRIGTSINLEIREKLINTLRE